jgi:DNA polymerase-1
VRVIIDIEANGLSPTKIWVIVCKDIDTNNYYIFRKVTEDELEKQRFLDFSRGVKLWCGHNILDYDFLVLHNLINFPIPEVSKIVDTYVFSKLYNYSRPQGHSIEDYGIEFGLPKITFNDWSKYSLEMENYCVRDVDINHKVFSLYEREILSRSWKLAFRCEQQFQLIVSDINRNGFAFNVDKANLLLAKVKKELETLDKEILDVFKPREVLIREFTPKATKFGTINKSSIPVSLRSNIHNYEIGKTYKQTHLVSFNPSSHKQIIDVLYEAGWKPTDKTKTHKDYIRNKKPLDKLVKYGYSINELNLNTLPSTAPPPARTLAKRILLESRRRTLTEWLSLVDEDTGRIHGKFISIGAWTHRMAHQKPNMANIPNTHDTNGKIKLLGGDMRSLFIAPKKRLLVGVDAESIQLRIFAHYIDDEEFTNALVSGKKSDKTDPHSLNQRILGDCCKSRQAAKRFIYALLLGGGLGKLSEVLEATRQETEEAMGRLLRRYTGFATLKKTIIPKDAKRGYFTGLDGRFVPILGETQRDREHLAMSGYLQNGEAVVMKHATIDVYPKLKQYDALLVDLVHDEWQAECPNSGIHEYAIPVAEAFCESLERTGIKLKLKCPMKGSYWSDEYNDYTISTNWKMTH